MRHNGKKVCPPRHIRTNVSRHGWSLTMSGFRHSLTYKIEPAPSPKPTTTETLNATSRQNTSRLVGQAVPDISSRNRQRPRTNRLSHPTTQPWESDIDRCAAPQARNVRHSLTYKFERAPSPEPITTATPHGDSTQNTPHPVRRAVPDIASFANGSSDILEVQQLPCVIGTRPVG